MARISIPLQSRASTYLLLATVVVGLLVAGLSVPIIFGDSGGDTLAAGPSQALGPSEFGDGDSLGDGTAGNGDAGADPGAPVLDGGVQPAGGSGPSFSGSGSGTGGATGGGRTGGSGGGSTGAGGGGATGGSGGGSGGSTPATPPPSSLTASDRGVTPDSIKVGFMVLDVGSIGRFGISVGLTPEQQVESWNAYVGELNNRGGILGRKVVPFFKTYDVLSQESMREACLAATKDEKVFMAIDVGGIYGAGILCFTKENQTPLISLGGSGMSEEWFRLSEGRLFTIFQNGTRAMRNYVDQLHRLGALKDAKVGVLDDVRNPGTPETVNKGLLPVLEELGYEVVHRATLSADLSTGSSQIPVEVQQMRSAGATHILFASNTLYATQFVQHADGQRWYPKYFTSDWENGYSDTYPQNTPASFGGSTLITTNRTGEWRVGLPEPAVDAECRKVWEAATGQKLDRTTTHYSSTVRTCSSLGLFERAATAAGPKLTREGFSAGFQGIGKVEYSTFAAVSFARGKFDGADAVRTAKWDAPCKCWKPVDNFRQTRY